MKTIRGTYGSGMTPCNVFVYGNWYCVEGSVNVNCACYSDELTDGVDVEMVSDMDCFTWSGEINSEEELEKAVNY